MSDFLTELSALYRDGIGGYIEQLPSDVLESLACGPHPEPLCNVCRSLDLLGERETGKMATYAYRLAIWHDEPRMSLGSNPRRRDYCPASYQRCMVIYNYAWTLLESQRTEGATGADVGETGPALPSGPENREGNSGQRSPVI